MVVGQVYRRLGGGGRWGGEIGVEPGGVVEGCG